MNPSPRKRRSAAKVHQAARPGASPDLRELTIESIGAQGDGLSGRLFAPLTLPGETVLASISGDRADLVAVRTASPDRVTAPCAHFGECGGCALQHWARAPYLAWKADTIRAALARVRIETEILPPFAVPPGTRRRLALHARRVDGVVRLGLKARRSWRVTPIEGCLVAEPRLLAGLPALTALAAHLFDRRDSAPTLHVTSTLTGLDVEVSGVRGGEAGLAFETRVGLTEAARCGDIARLSLGREVVYEARTPAVLMGAATVALPPGAFLQAVGAAEQAMAEFVAASVAGAGRIADLYCGVGAFAIPLAALAPVTAADISPSAVKALAAAAGGVPGLKSISAEARDLERRPILARELSGLDAVVIDPPRAGAAAQHGEIARSNCPKVVGVSCNPVTFARDARILADGGYRLERVLPVDQFLWSPHIELVGVFTREGH